MKEAYKSMDGVKIEGRRILVDVERGRTVDAWRPMRLAGGLGGDSRLPKESKKKARAAAIAAGLPPPVDDRGPPRCACWGRRVCGGRPQLLVGTPDRGCRYRPALAPRAWGGWHRTRSDTSLWHCTAGPCRPPV
jgi:hypothetical protein